MSDFYNWMVVERQFMAGIAVGFLCAGGMVWMAHKLDKWFDA